MKHFNKFCYLIHPKKKKKTRSCVFKRKLQILFGFHPAGILVDLLRRNGYEVDEFKFTDL